LGEGFASSVSRGLAVAIKLLLSRLHRFAGGGELWVGGHRDEKTIRRIGVERIAPVRGSAYGPVIASAPKKSGEGKLTFKDLLRVAFEGAVGNAAWALVLVAAVVFAALLNGHVALWLFAVVLLVMLGISGFISTALLRRAEQMRGASDEARQQAADAVQRAIEIEEQAGAEKRELREQLAAASGGQEAVSTRMQSVARQVDALAAIPTGRPYGPDKGQIRLLISLLEDFDQKHPNDPVVLGLLGEWSDAEPNTGEASWQAALHVLKARALSLGAEEALGR
jgi:hypothetical protein